MADDAAKKGCVHHALRSEGMLALCPICRDLEERDLFGASSRMAALLEPRCQICGCDEAHACDVVAFIDRAAPELLTWYGVNPPNDLRGCRWANLDKNLCTVCAALLRHLAAQSPERIALATQLALLLRTLQGIR